MMSISVAVLLHLSSNAPKRVLCCVKQEDEKLLQSLPEEDQHRVMKAFFAQLKHRIRQPSVVLRSIVASVLVSH